LEFREIGFEEFLEALPELIAEDDGGAGESVAHGVEGQFATAFLGDGTTRTWLIRAASEWSSDDSGFTFRVEAE
jgi:hypothetical protein